MECLHLQVVLFFHCHWLLVCLLNQIQLLLKRKAIVDASLLLSKEAKANTPIAICDEILKQMKGENVCKSIN